MFNTDHTHAKLTAPERAHAEDLRKNYIENGATVDDGEPLYSVPGDCGRLHLSDLAAAACANARSDVAEARITSASKPARRMSNTADSDEVHAELTAAERAHADALQDNYIENGFTVDDDAPLHRVPGDCGKLHLSDLAAAACANVRADEAASRVNEAPKPAPRAAPMPRRAGPMTSAEILVSGASVPLAERILAAVATSNFMSVNAIVRKVGARRQDVYAQVGAMFADGRLAKVNEVIRLGLTGGAQRGST